MAQISADLVSTLHLPFVSYLENQLGEYLPDWSDWLSANCKIASWNRVPTVVAL